MRSNVAPDETRQGQDPHAPTADGLVIVQWFFLGCQVLLGMVACSSALRSSGRGLEASRHSSEAALFAVFFFGIPLSIAAIAVTLSALFLRTRWGGRGFSKAFFVVSCLAVLFPFMTAVGSMFVSIIYAYP